MDDLDMLKNDFLGVIDAFTRSDLEKEEILKHLRATTINFFDSLKDLKDTLQK